MFAAPADHAANRVRGPMNAAFFTLMDAYIDWMLARHKRRVYADMPREVVELGPGVGANFRYMARGTHVTAVEPNPHMHHRLRRRARRHGLQLDLRSISAEHIDLDDGCADMVISSLVLCTVADPRQALAEVRRVLRPHGRYAFVEHVAARPGSTVARLQRAVRRPWGWVFEGCSCERDLASLIREAGFERVEIERYLLHSPLLPFNTQIAGVAWK